MCSHGINVFSGTLHAYTRTHTNWGGENGYTKSRLLFAVSSLSLCRSILYRTCSLQNVFSIECVLDRMGTQSHVFCSQCPLFPCVDLFSTECVLYRMCSLWNMLSLRTPPRHTHTHQPHAHTHTPTPPTHPPTRTHTHTHTHTGNRGWDQQTYTSWLAKPP